MLRWEWETVGPAQRADGHATLFGEGSRQLRQAATFELCARVQWHRYSQAHDVTVTAETISMCTDYCYDTSLTVKKLNARERGRYQEPCIPKAATELDATGTATAAGQCVRCYGPTIRTKARVPAYQC